MVDALKETAKKFLTTMCLFDEDLEHSPDVCGTCCMRYTYAQVAREMLENGCDGRAIIVWNEEVQKRWQATPLCNLWHDEINFGR